MSLIDVVLFIVGLGLLTLGGESLVRGASRLAATLGIAPVIVGLTVVAFGTSAPELAVSIFSAYRGQADIAVGNVVGSNIFNILFILGISALITPMVVARRIVRFDVPLMIASALALFFAGLNGIISRWEGLILVAGLVAYNVFMIRQSRADKELAEEGDEAQKTPSSLAANLMFILIGLVMLVVGSDFLVDSAVAFARSLGVSELIIGLTIVAVGTSLPEVAASIVAALRGERDIAVGNVIGSNLFNVLSVVGICSTVAPNGLPVSDAALRFDMPVMIAVSVACFPVFLNGFVVRRWEGGVFVAYYFAYTSYLILKASHHDALPAFSNVMMWFVLPITVLTLTVTFLFTLQRRRLATLARLLRNGE